MDPLTLNQLLALMEEQIKVMNDLTALNKKKSQVLIDGNIDELDILLRGEQALIWQMGRLEERRFQAQVTLSSQLGIHPSQLTLERLLELVSSDYGARCEVVASQYAQTAGELAQTNQLNTELIQQSMAYVDFSLQLLGATSPAAGQVYSPRGPRPSNVDGKQKRLDSRA